MGHQSGLARVGAKGRRQALTHPTLLAAAESEIAEIQESHVEKIRELARTFDSEAVELLVKIMRGRVSYVAATGKRSGVPPGVRRQAARDLLELGYSTSGVIENPLTAAAKSSGGLTIQILNLSEGKQEPMERAHEMRAAIDHALDAYETVDVRPVEQEVRGVDGADPPISVSEAESPPVEDLEPLPDRAAATPAIQPDWRPA